jgi:hypothetical protein
MSGPKQEGASAREKKPEQENNASKDKPEQSSSLPKAVLDAIHGRQAPEEKKAQYDQSLGNWWSEYAARKNDEEEEHVADSLLYDERCHLPRSAPRPDVVPSDSSVKKNTTEASK